jgi:sugar O-acyltransferase (sialic acid O-acetyltransferase NeuD family)
MRAPVKVIVLGAGGNSLGILDALAACNAAVSGARYEVVGVLDDIPANLGRRVLGHAVLGAVAEAGKFADCRFVNGISSLESFRAIPDIVRRTGMPIARFETVVHPRATVSPDAQVGRGSVILAGSVIAPEAVIGDHVIILQNTSVNHHSRVGDHATLSAGITVLGYVDIGANAFVGGGSTLAPRVRIGESAVVGAGSVVIRDVPAGRVFAGNPARELAGSQHALD